jgi:hypothetical protein
MKIRVLGLLLCAVFLTGCGTGPVLSSPPLEEPYSGFDLLPQQDTPVLAYERGALVQEEFQTTKGAEYLDAFLRKTASGQPATLQIAFFYEADQTESRRFIWISCIRTAVTKPTGRMPRTDLPGPTACCAPYPDGCPMPPRTAPSAFSPTAGT